MARTEMAHGNAITAALLAVEHKKQAVEKAKIALIEAEASSEQAREMYLAALDLSSSVGNDAEKAKLYAEFQAAESGIAPAKEAIRDTNLSLKVAIETANALKRDLLRFIPKDSLMSSTNSRGMFRITAPSEALFLIAELERQIGGKTEESRWMVSIPAGSADVEIDLNNLNLNK